MYPLRAISNEWPCGQTTRRDSRTSGILQWRTVHKSAKGGGAGRLTGESFREARYSGLSEVWAGSPINKYAG